MNRFLKKFYVLLLAGLLFWPGALSADQAQYFYDALGRLNAVSDGQGDVAFYNYDKVGNLLSITRGMAAASTVTTISPPSVEAGRSTVVTITGTGFVFNNIPAVVTPSSTDVVPMLPSPMWWPRPPQLRRR